MNLWDNLPCELQTYILRLRLASSLQKNWRRHPAIRSNLIAKSLLSTCPIDIMPPMQYPPWMRMSVMCPSTASALEYCAKHSGMGYPEFWTGFCVTVLAELIQDQYSGGPGSQYYNRCETAHEILVLKYDTDRANSHLQMINQ